MFRAGNASMDYPVTRTVLGEECGFITIRHNALCINTSKSLIGETRIFIKDVQDLKLNTILETTELRELKYLIFPTSGKHIGQAKHQPLVSLWVSSHSYHKATSRDSTSP